MNKTLVITTLTTALGLFASHRPPNPAGSVGLFQAASFESNRQQPK
jgi:hypothetical protein